MTNAEKVIKNKMGLIKLAEQLGNVSRAARSSAILGIASTASKICTLSREKKACAN
jgi:hypothetical protein